MSKSFIIEGDAEKKQKQKELLLIGLNKHEWFGTETPNYQLIEAIV